MSACGPCSLLCVIVAGHHASSPAVWMFAEIEPEFAWSVASWRENQMDERSSPTVKIAVTATPSEAERAPLLFRGDLAAAFRQASQLSCHGVELHLRRAADVDSRVVLRLMAEYGLEVPTLGTGMAASEDGLTFSNPNEHIRLRAVERICEHVRLAAQLRAAVTIGSVTGNLGACRGERRSARRRQAIECLAKVCCLAEPLGVTVLLEPLNRYECDYISTIADGAAIVTEVSKRNLKLLADTFHMNIEEVDLAECLATFKGLVGYVHLADSNRQAPGHGHLDFVRILGALSAAHYAGYLSLEVLPIPTPKQATVDAVVAIRAAGVEHACA